MQVAAQSFALCPKRYAGAGVDSDWEQRKLEARKMLDTKRAAHRDTCTALA